MTLISILPTGLPGHHRIRNQRQGARAFDRGRHLPLMLGAIPGNAARDDFASFGDEVLEGRLILEVHLAVLFRAETADLLPAEPPPSAPFFLVPSVPTAAASCAS